MKRSIIFWFSLFTVLVSGSALNAIGGGFFRRCSLFSEVRSHYSTVLNCKCAGQFSDDAMGNVTEQIQAGKADDLIFRVLRAFEDSENQSEKKLSRLFCDLAVLSLYSSNSRYLGDMLGKAIFFNNVVLIEMLVKNSKTDLSNMITTSDAAEKHWCNLAYDNPMNSGLQEMCGGAQQINQELTKFNKKRQRKFE